MKMFAYKGLGKDGEGSKIQNTVNKHSGFFPHEIHLLYWSGKKLKGHGPKHYFFRSVEFCSASF